jgi:SAM-dependent methyltransferase
MALGEFSVRSQIAVEKAVNPSQGHSRATLALAAVPAERPFVDREHSLPKPTVPDYLEKTYRWAYLRPSSVWLLDRPQVVNTILWGNYRRLLRAALAEMRPGQRVYQPACVYGGFSHQVAEYLGADGHLDVGDVAPVQVDNCRRKLSDCKNVRVHLWNAADKGPGGYDTVCCFFLLHEIPEAYKHRVVDQLLEAIEPDGKLVFVDYHGPRRGHPLKWIMRFINYSLEPFARALWDNEISSYASRKDAFTWTKQTYFGGLYQKVVVERRP